MWTGKHTAILGAASVLCLGVGSVSGYMIARVRLQEEYDKKLDAEIAATAVLYKNLNKPSPEELAESLLESEAPPQKSPYDTTSSEVPAEVLAQVASSMARAQEQVEEEAKPFNAFENPLPEWNQADEEDSRRNGVPYIISHDEFYENQWEFEEGHLTYYEGDDTVADSRDEPILNQYEVVGELTLERFGHGSQDPNIVHVCNEKMQMIFEIARSSKSFAEDVLGFVDTTTELKHSDRPRKFRLDRDD